MKCGEETSESLLDKGNEILQKQSKLLETIAENSDKAYDKQIEYINLLGRCYTYLTTFDILFEVEGLSELVSDIDKSFGIK